MLNANWEIFWGNWIDFINISRKLLYTKNNDVEINRTEKRYLTPEYLTIKYEALNVIIKIVIW